MRKSTETLRREDGQALVELALVVPLLLFIIFAIIDFGLALNQYNNTTNLANLGARATAVLSSGGSATNTTPGTCTYTHAGTPTTYTTLVGYIDCEGATEGSLSQATVTVCDATSTSAFTTGDSLSVKVSSTFSWMGILQGGIGRIGGIVGPTSTIASTATMRMEGAVGTTSTATWLGADASHDMPNSASTVPAPTITTSGC